MTYPWKRLLLCLLAIALCVAFIGCGEEETGETEGTTLGKPIIPQNSQPPIQEVRYTPVYATAFEDTVILATVPMEEWHGLEPECPTREISNGGRICCNGDHEKETPITKVIILEDLIPRVCAGWFRDMIHLETVEGTERLLTHEVTDMSYMFYGCEKLASLDYSSWDVSALEASEDMFEGCNSLTELPDWYQQN